MAKAPAHLSPSGWSLWDQPVGVPVRVPGGGFLWTVLDPDDVVLVTKPLTLHVQGYAKMGREYLHRALLNAGRGQAVDHLNGDKLDNRRDNLRFATWSQNGANRPKPDWQVRSVTSRYKGVSRSPSCDRWAAYISADGRTRYLGLFRTEEEAALAYDRAAGARWGGYAVVNLG